MRITPFLMVPFILAPATATAAAAATGKDAAPVEVRVFVKNAEMCEHMAEEWDSNLEPQRKKEIERAIVKYCAPAHQQHKQLAGKYKHDRKLRKLISDHAYDSVTAYSE
jgi:hypothetical protein